MAVKAYIPKEKGLRRSIVTLYTTSLSVKAYIPKEKGLRLNQNSNVKKKKKMVKAYIPKEKGLRHNKYSELASAFLTVKAYIPKEKGLRRYSVIISWIASSCQSVYSKRKRIKTRINQLVCFCSCLSKRIFQKKKD